MSTVLFVVTGARSWTLSDGATHPTGYWAEELLTPFRLLTGAGHDVVFATPGGIPPVADEGSLDSDETRAALAEIVRLSEPLRLEDVALGDYDAVFYPGGHGPMEDLAVDPVSGALIADALETATPLALVCHGVAALLAARGADGALAAAGRRVTAFTDEEEIQSGLAARAPWLLETTLRDNGVEVATADAWADHVIEDGALITGQNPQSSGSVARALLARLGA